VSPLCPIFSTDDGARHGGCEADIRHASTLAFEALRYPAARVNEEPEQIAIADLPGGFGALEVLGATADRARAGDDVFQESLRAALADRAVLCLRQPQALEDADLRAVAQVFGPIKDPVGLTKDGNTLRYSEERQIVDAGFVLTDELRAELGDLNFGGLDTQRPGLFETFHTDDSYTEAPAAVTVLHARELPSDGGGPTWFLDMRAAYRALEPEVQQRILGLRALNRYNNGGAFPPRVSAEGPYEHIRSPDYQRSTSTWIEPLRLRGWRLKKDGGSCDSFRITPNVMHPPTHIPGRTTTFSSGTMLPSSTVRAAISGWVSHGSFGVT